MTSKNLYMFYLLNSVWSRFVIVVSDSWDTAYDVLVEKDHVVVDGRIIDWKEWDVLSESMITWVGNISIHNTRSMNCCMYDEHGTLIGMGYTGITTLSNVVEMNHVMFPFPLMYKVSPSTNP